MSDLFDALQERYQMLVARKEKGETEESFLEDVRAFITDAQQAGATVADLNERSQLRAWMRFLANALYDTTGVYPDVMLQPLAHGQLVGLQPERREKPSPSFPLAWVLVGGAAVIVIAVGLVAIGWMSYPNDGAAPTPMSTSTPTPIPTPAPFVSQIAMGTELDTGGALRVAADTFCLGTSEVVAEFTLEGIEPETVWHWEVQREGEIVGAQPAAPWGKEAQHATIHALTGGLEGVEPGQYELLVYVGEQVAGVHSFQVLDKAPCVFNLRVTDVPDPAGQASDGPDENKFEAGVRVIYLGYEYEGLCPGLDVSHALYHEGAPVQESVEPWSDAPQGQAQVSFQAPGDLPFPSGDYEVTVAVAGEEQERVGLTIGEVMGEVSPAFGDIAIALGVQPDGTPILTAQDDRFDWSTKVVYAIFDYVGMSDGLRWAAVWTRNDQEVAREEHFWDVETDGMEGTRWVAYHDESGRTLTGGNYSVTLYIKNVAQRTAEFNIRYYVPQ